MGDLAGLWEWLLFRCRKTMKAFSSKGHCLLAAGSVKGRLMRFCRRDFARWLCSSAAFSLACSRRNRCYSCRSGDIVATVAKALRPFLGLANVASPPASNPVLHLILAVSGHQQSAAMLNAVRMAAIRVSFNITASARKTLINGGVAPIVARWQEQRTGSTHRSLSGKRSRSRDGCPLG